MRYNCLFSLLLSKQSGESAMHSFGGVGKYTRRFGLTIHHTVVKHYFLKSTFLGFTCKGHLLFISAALSQIKHFVSICSVIPYWLHFLHI